MEIHGYALHHDNDTTNTLVILEENNFFSDLQGAIFRSSTFQQYSCWFLTLVLKPEAWFVLRMIAVEIYRCLVRGGEKRRRDVLAAESANHCAGIQGPVAYLKEIMVGLGGEVKELYVGPWKTGGRLYLHLTMSTNVAALRSKSHQLHN